MNNKLLMMLLNVVIGNIVDMCLDKETQLKFIDSLLDSLKDFVQRTDNTIDDKFVIPLVDSIRKNFDIPD